MVTVRDSFRLAAVSELLRQWLPTAVAQPREPGRVQAAESTSTPAPSTRRADNRALSLFFSAVRNVVMGCVCSRLGRHAAGSVSLLRRSHTGQTYPRDIP